MNLQKLQAMGAWNPLPSVPQYGLGDSKIVWTKGKHFHSWVSWLAVSCEVVVKVLPEGSSTHILVFLGTPGDSWGFRGISGDS